GATRVGGRDGVQPRAGPVPPRRDGGGARPRVRRAVHRPRRGRTVDRSHRLVRRLGGQAPAGPRRREPRRRPVLQLHRPGADRRRGGARPRRAAAPGPRDPPAAPARGWQRGRRGRIGATAARRDRARRGGRDQRPARRGRQPAHGLPLRARARSRGPHGRERARSRRRERGGSGARAARGGEREARRPRRRRRAEPLGDRELPRAQDRLAPDRSMTARYATDAGMAQRRFSHAIAEGDGISVIAAVEDPDAARAAEEQLAEALVVRGDPAVVRGASSLPILWRADVSLERASTSADAYLLVFDALDDDDGRLEELHAQAVELGLDCAVEVRDEEELEQALERVDPEIFLLSPVEREDDETPLEVVLEMLAAVPAGKLAIADLQ